jgi:hypothetical protein
VTVTSDLVTTNGNNSAGVIVNQGQAPEEQGPGTPEGAAADIGVGPGVIINVATSNTAGSNSPALSGNSANGFVQIVNDTATTQGDNSIAIRATAYDDVEITTAHVSTLGSGSTGVYAVSTHGDIVVNAGDVSTAAPRRII